MRTRKFAFDINWPLSLAITFRLSSLWEEKLFSFVFIRLCLYVFISFCGKYFAFKRNQKKKEKSNLKNVSCAWSCELSLFHQSDVLKNLYSLFWQQENLFSVFKLGQTRCNSTEVEIKAKANKTEKLLSLKGQ